MKSAATAVALLMLWAALPAAQAQFTHPRPLQRAIDEHQALLLARAYDKLDKVADEARARNLRTSDGQNLLAALYRGAAGCTYGNQFTDELWKVRRERLEEWRARNPASITARVSLARYPAQYGWFARGCGFAPTVSESAWKLFRERIEEGRIALAGLDAHAKSDPGWFEGMLDVAIAQHWPRARFDALFEEGVARHPDYLPLYFAAASYSAAKWHGSDDEQRRLIAALTERTRPAMGESLYARLHWTHQSRDMFKSGRTDWTRMKAGFERIQRDYPDPWNLNNFARFACLAGDPATVRQLTAAIGDKPVAAAWLDDLQYYATCRRWAEQAGQATRK
jgi:hypothetical protein